MAQHEEQFGEYGVTEEDEQQKLAVALQLSGSKDYQNRETPVLGERTSTEEWTGSSHTWYVCEDDQEFADSQAEEEAREDSGPLVTGPATVEAARVYMAEFDYERGLEVCLELLRRDYDDQEAHHLLLDTFHTLGFKNELVQRVRGQLRDIMIRSHSEKS